MAKCEFSIRVGKTNLTLKSEGQEMEVIMAEWNTSVSRLHTRQVDEIRRLAKQLEQMADFVENNGVSA